MTFPTPTPTDHRRAVAQHNPYAKHTDVPVARSKAEIEQLLQRYGAEKFVSGWEAAGAVILFEAHARRVKFYLPLPGADAFRTKEFKRPSGRGMYTRDVSAAEAERAMDQEHRRRWRALALVIKAKLEAVQSGIAEFEDEFLAHIIVPGGQTIGEKLRPQIDESYRTGKLPPLLGTGS